MARIGVLVAAAEAAASAPSYPDRLREAGAEPVPISIPEIPHAGVALRREWTADAVEMLAAGKDLDGLLLAAAEPERLAGLVQAALRLGLPAVVCGEGAAMSAAVAALGFSPASSGTDAGTDAGTEAAGVAVEVCSSGGPLPGELVDSFTLANALRVGCSLGGGPEVLVHLAAIGREAGASGFDQMLRVLAPETKTVARPDSDWYRRHGLRGLLAHLGEAIHSSTTVAGELTEDLPESVPEPPHPVSTGLSFMSDDYGAVEVLGWGSDTGRQYASGMARVFVGEAAAVKGVEDGVVRQREVLVVGGCGPRVAPGILRLSALARALSNSELAGRVAVFTDGLAPADAPGVWASLARSGPGFGGLPGRIRDGDRLYLGIKDEVVRLGAPVSELREREPEIEGFKGTSGYRARYARSALPGVEGGGFG